AISYVPSGSISDWSAMIADAANVGTNWLADVVSSPAIALERFPSDTVIPSDIIGIPYGYIIVDTRSGTPHRAFTVGELFDRGSRTQEVRKYFVHRIMEMKPHGITRRQLQSQIKDVLDGKSIESGRVYFIYNRFLPRLNGKTKSD